MWSSSNIEQALVDKSDELMIHHFCSGILAAHTRDIFSSVWVFVAAPADVAICPVLFSVHSPVLVAVQMLAVRPDLVDSQWLVAVLQLGHGQSHFPQLNSKSFSGLVFSDELVFTCLARYFMYGVIWYLVVG